VNVLEAMTDGDGVVSVSPETTLKQVAELMLEHGFSGVPVVDADRRVLGVVSEADIVGGEAGPTGEGGMLARARAFAGPARASMPRTAGEAMSSPAVTIGPDETVVHAARLIAERGVNRLPVVDEDGKLVGILTRADVVRAFVRSDEQLAADVRAAVGRILGHEAGTVEVAVADGEVVLSGEVDTATSGRLLEFFAARIPGVVAVRSELRTREDDEEPSR